MNAQHQQLFERCGIAGCVLGDGDLVVRSPIDGAEVGRVRTTPPASVHGMLDAAGAAFAAWRMAPPPLRGELVRLWGEELRAAKEDIGALITLEVGKIVAEGRGEVQEGVDICEFALGLSRQLYGRTIASERPGHRMMEQWHPLGPVAVITAFNFPCAVFAWNAAIALVCGDPVIFKPSEKAPLSGLATFAALERAIARFGPRAPAGLAQIAIGGGAIGELLVDDPRVALVSATGSTRMGRAIGPRVAARFGRRILELGGNNAMLLRPSADLELALRAILFSAVGTAGQRCTTLRRLIVDPETGPRLLDRLIPAYRSLKVGDPREPSTLVGPLIDRAAFDAMQSALDAARAQGGELLVGGERVEAEQGPDAFYVRPAIVRMPAQTAIVREETFAPILHVLEAGSLAEAIAIHNDVPQGLASCIFSNDLREVEQFLSAAGSDCGIVNVNIGPSGAEIGGAFGGEKATGGDRESGSDAWKQYMRRATNTINYSTELPLAQGIVFG